MLWLPLQWSDVVPQGNLHVECDKSSHRANNIGRCLLWHFPIQTIQHLTSTLDIREVIPFLKNASSNNLLPTYSASQS